MIRVVDVHKSFGGQQVLKGVNLNFTTGKITTIVGTSGCGKTVLLKHLNALLLPDRGEIFVDDIDITKLRQKELYAMRGRFGVLFQGAALLDSMTIFDNVAFPLRETTGLDPVLATGIHQLIARTQQAFGFTGVVVSHTIPQVFEISDYVAILADGVIEEAKPTKEFQASQNPVVQQFIKGEIEGPIRVL
ncbi:MAG: ATP-binding cassette domain-containing protein, partial [Deltaproteobacteria bacterium]|nr:ATP-binding cassette domain-containing protein [Deltaproteobacteria bacterium]